MTIEIQNDISVEMLLNVYDRVRYVNPIEKKVAVTNEATLKNVNEKCFNVWGLDSACKNCISSRALQENKVTMKLEYVDQKIFMVTAIADIENHRVLELLRDVTNENLLENMNNLSSNMMIEKLEKLNLEVVTDNLTKLYNRRFLDEKLPYELIKDYTNQTPVSLVMFDIDHFKNINDTYGHPVGDQVLSELAEVIKSYVHGDDDWAVRYGGEEFFVYFLNLDKASLLKRVEELRLQVENKVFCAGSENIKLTISCGMYNGIIADREQINDVTLLVKKADAALYEAKNTGRNKSVFSKD